MLEFDVVKVPGASAQGIVNPHSKTHALNKFKEMLQKKTNNYDKVLVMLGEVDCGFVIWYRTTKYEISIDEQLTISINNLFSFIENNLREFYDPIDIVVIGSILPIIDDNTNKKFLGGQRATVKNSRDDRKNLTLKYNYILENKCVKLGYQYVDINNEVSTSIDGKVEEKYTISKFNHHLKNETTYDIWIDKFVELWGI